MKFNPVTKHLFTDDHQLIKKLNCPFNLNWEDLELTKSQGRKRCQLCNKEIIDTESMTESYLVQKMKQNPDLCLKVGLDQANIRVEINNA